MLINILVFFVILFLCFINGLTDATNAISTLVGTKVMNFRKACMLSALFDIIGVFVMYFINNTIVDCISNIALLPNGTLGLTALCIGMMSAILFSTVAMFLGIPTSESHGLISGITGSAIAIGGIISINFGEWYNVLIGLIWSILGTLAISKFIKVFIKNLVSKIKIKNIKTLQLISCLGMSFAHGAQDGLKFVGIMSIYSKIVTESNELTNEILIIFICALSMGVGVLIGGKKIVTNVGENLVKLENKDALCSDISTVISLITASFLGMPVSTTHVKTMSIASISNKRLNINVFKKMAITWAITFPICGILAFIIMRVVVGCY